MLSREALRHIHRLEIQTRRKITSLHGGQYQSAFRGKGMEFTDLRSYAYGDDIKAIHWNVTARTGAPHVKLYEEERELQIMIAVDVSASEYFGSRSKTKNELAAEIGAFLSMSAGIHNDHVGLLLFSDTVEHFVPPRKGKRHMLRIIRDILNFEPRGARTSIDYALRYCLKVLRRHGVVFVISDFLDRGFEKSLSVLARKHDVVGIMTLDERELLLPDAGRVLLEDAETGAVREIDTAPEENRARMAEEAGLRLARTEDALRNAGMNLIRLQTDKPIYEQLLEFFRRRMHRRSR